MTDVGPIDAASQCTYSPEFVQAQVRQIEECLVRALAGDFDAVRLPEGDTLWGNLAMHVNVVIHTTRTALTRAEQFEREAARLRATAGMAGDAQCVRSLQRPPLAVLPRDLVVDDE